MPTTCLEQFFLLDPSSPPPPGTALTVAQLNLIDQTSNGSITQNGAAGDRIDGSDIQSMYPGGTITVVMGGSAVTMTGVTFYLADGRTLFTPTDGTVLHNAIFQNSTFVTGTGGVPVSAFAPPCFTPGTLILTPSGETPVETLNPGDPVETQDRGAQEVRWVGSCTVDGGGDHAPIRFEAGTVGNDRPLLVSPQHRMVISGWRPELFMAEPEVLVPAKHLLGMEGVDRAPMPEVEYIHLLFDQHEIIFAEGAPTESFYPGSTMIEGNAAIRQELEEFFPELLAEGLDPSPARLIATGREARVLYPSAPLSP